LVNMVIDRRAAQAQRKPSANHTLQTD